MENRHHAVGTLIHVDGLLGDAQWSGHSQQTLTKIYDTIERLSEEAADTNAQRAEAVEATRPRQDQNGSAPRSATGPDWALSAWDAPAGPCYIAHHLPTRYTIRTQSLHRLKERIVEHFSEPKPSVKD